MDATHVVRARPVRGRPRIAGFTLVEVLVALFIFAVGMLAVASMQAQSIRGNSFSDLLTVATTLAEAQMEHLLSLASTNSALQDSNPANNANLLGATDTSGATGSGQWDGHCDDANSDGSPDLLNRQGSASGQGPFLFRRIWNVASNYPATGFTTVVVIVQWRDQRGNHQVYASSVR
jgi:type IV pilus modification protein PilV